MDSQTRTRNMRTHLTCSACRILRRRCGVNCILAPYFPTEEAENFVRVHKVFGASNVIKMLQQDYPERILMECDQMVEESRREDAVKSLVYEAHTRLKDPVYGCTGAIFYLQKHVKELEEQLQSARAEAMELKAKKDQLFETFIDVHLSPVNDSVFDHFFVGDPSCTISASSNSTL
ncbi:LOB domain-containing protein 24-like [Aristolochia californica]|uniref:LOB domain-containing protein 24-like n=1 Tax=Aristolochia californica TaxID=171875 RepID=UPI0035D79070